MQTQIDQIPFRIHPRVFAALGADLVTNDVVAVIELVKNSYDAYACNVHLRFCNSPEHGMFMEIRDDGCGMTRDIIENAWCLVATPHKKKNPIVKSGQAQRRVAGEKGLGRLSAARLGNRLYMQTKASGDICWEVEVDWPRIAEGNDLSRSFATCRPYQGASALVSKTGTCIRIYDLSEKWDNEKLDDLEDNLARLISPFSGKEDFKIFLSRFGDSEGEAIEIDSPAFLAQPKYSICGSVDNAGNIDAYYKFSPLTENAPREKKLSRSWDITHGGVSENVTSQNTHCGPFEFEIRAWDIASDDTEEIAKHFDLKKSLVRKSIRAHKGISIYRDGMLVLPKSENARDWLGLDLRRISRIGTRLSTTQIVGYVSITAKDNPCIEDTSDRERLVSCREVSEFEEILKSIVDLLEIERDIDRTPPAHGETIENLFENLDAKNLLAEVKMLSDDGESAAETIPAVRAFAKSLTSTRKVIQKRMAYYSRLATVGTIAHMLVHEIRNRTIAIGGFLEIIKDRFSPFSDERVKKKYTQADHSIDSLEKLADTFSPLANRNFRRGKRHSILEDQIKECLLLHQNEIDSRRVKLVVPTSSTNVAVDPGELDAILLNLIANAVYWMESTPKNKRKIIFKIAPMADNVERVQVYVQDTGPGVNEDDIEKIFWPGVTRKPNGIGMGLTVASELIATYGGRTFIEQDDSKEGASFGFDLPLIKRS